MSTTLANLEAFQAFNEGLDGVASAPQPDETPVTPAAFPCLITTPGPAQWQTGKLAAGLKCRRQYLIRALVAPTTLDSRQVIPAVTTLLEAVGNAYRAQRAIGGQTLLEVSDQGWGGLGLVEWGSAEYYGFYLAVTIQET